MRLAHRRGHRFGVDRFAFVVLAAIVVGNRQVQRSFGVTRVDRQRTLERLFGFTGIFFARFSTPSARLIFSNTAVIGTHDGKPSLVFRMANARSTAIVEATIKVYLSQNEVLADGEVMRRVYDLTMRRNTSPLFALSWTATHTIDESSPLFGLTAKLAEERGLQLIVTFTGIDDRLAATVHSRFTYPFDRIAFGQRLVDIFEVDSAGVRFMNMAKFHDTVDVATPRA